MGGSICGIFIETQNAEVQRNLEVVPSSTLLCTNDETDSQRGSYRGDMGIIPCRNEKIISWLE